MRAFLPCAALLLALATPARAEFDVIIKVGDIAPGFPAGHVVKSFAEPPSISGGGYVVLHLVIDGPSSDPSAIYRWHAPNDMVLVAQTGQNVVFPVGTRSIAFFESPIVDRSGHVAFSATMDTGKALVVWDSRNVTDLGTPILSGVAKTGDGVVLTCDTVSGSPCADYEGTLNTLPNFTTRRSAAFAEGKLFFVASVAVTLGGSANAVWLWDLDNPSLVPIANSRQRADVPAEVPVPFYQAFTNVATLDGELFGLADVSQGKPKTVYRFDQSGEGHTLLERSYAPDATLRFDFHVEAASYGYAGGATQVQGDTNPAGRGVWQDGLQVYSNGVTPAPLDLDADFLGVPRGFAPFTAGTAVTYALFAAKLVGGTANGKSAVFLADVGVPVVLLAELDLLPGSTHTVERIYTAHAGDPSLAIHIQRRANVGGALSEALLLVGPDFVDQEFASGDTIDLGPFNATITGFRLLGRDFVDTVVTGSGKDGLLTPIANEAGVALVIDYTLAAATAKGGQVAGAGAIMLRLDDLFADGFESP